MPVKVKEGGRTRTRSTQEVALMVLRETALKGNSRALDRLFELAQRLGEFDWSSYVSNVAKHAPFAELTGE